MGIGAGDLMMLGEGTPRSWISPSHLPHRYPPYTLQMELAVLKAIKGREDCLDRLRAPLP